MPRFTLDKLQVQPYRLRLQDLLTQVEQVTTTPQASAVSLTLARGTHELSVFIRDTLIPAAQASGAFPESPAEKKLRKALTAVHRDLHLPVPLADPEVNITPEGAWARFRGLRGSWLAQARATSELFWKALTTYLKSVGGFVSYAGNEDYQTQLEGFSVRLRGRGHDPDSPETQRHLELLGATLRLFRKNLQQHAPRLVGRMLPLRYIAGEGHRFTSGQYAGDAIDVYVPGPFYDPPRLAHTLAHENGHHLWRTYLSGDAQAAWVRVIRDDLGELDLVRLVREWPEGTDEFSYLRQVGDSDPVYSLQLRTVMFPSKGEPPFTTREEVATLVARGIRTLPVPRSPITPYANYNPEEAFCEAFGMLVAYGPRAVLPVVRSWLRMVLPEVRTASRAAAQMTRVYHVSPEAGITRFKGRYSPKFHSRGLFVAPSFRAIRNDWAEYVGAQRGELPYRELTVYELELPAELYHQAEAQHVQQAQRAQEALGSSSEFFGAWGWGAETFLPEDMLSSVRIVGRKTYPLHYFRERTRRPDEDRDSVYRTPQQLARTNPAAQLWLDAKEYLLQRALKRGKLPEEFREPVRTLLAQVERLYTHPEDRYGTRWISVPHLEGAQKSLYRRLEREWGEVVQKLESLPSLRTAAQRPFPREEIKRLRADFLLLMKNAERVTSWREAQRFQRAVNTYREHLEAVVYKGLIPAIRAQHGETWSGKDIAKTAWNLVIDLKAPLENPYDPFNLENRPWITEEWAYPKYRQEQPKWSARVKEKARLTWKAMDEYFQYLSPEGPLAIQHSQEEQLELAGFRVRVRDMEPAHVKYLDRITEGLRYFRQRATQVLPWLVRYALPFKIEYKEDMGDAAATYNHDGTISLNGFWVAGQYPEDSAQQIAHEMSHHLWRAYLSDSDQALWEHLIRSDRGELDLRELLAAWPLDKADRAYWIDGDPLRERDPILYLQLYAVLHPPGGESLFSSRAEVEQALAGGRTTVPVPRNPITVYATKNPEEAFCEAVSYRVAYGARGVLPAVASWLDRVLPGMLKQGRSARELDYLDLSGPTVARFRKELPEYDLEIIAGEEGKLTAEDLERAREVHRKLQKGIGESADVCQLSPQVCRQNLGLDRAQMPQIPEASLPELLRSKDKKEKAKGEAAREAGADPKDSRPLVEVFLEHLRESGVRVGDPEDEEPIAIGKLHATQKEIKADKTYQIAESYYRGEFDPEDSPLLVSEDDYILDGHHRWSALITADPDIRVPVRRIYLPVRELLERAFRIPGVFRMDLQDRVVDGGPPSTTLAAWGRVGSLRS